MQHFLAILCLQDHLKAKKETAMNVKIHYRITQDRAGIPMDYTGARHFRRP
jgi:hypothetical protein